MKAGFTGTRNGMTTAQRRTFARLLRELDVQELHHGDCKGADAEAHDVFRNVYFAGPQRVVVHPPVDPRLRANCVGNEVRELAPYLQRDRNIVDETDLLIAVPKSTVEEVRSGTWFTVRYARRSCRDIHLIWPDGTVTHQGRSTHCP